MFSFEGKCPHCFSDRGFLAFGIGPMELFDYKKSDLPPAILEKLKTAYADNALGWYSLGGNCQSCGRPVVAKVLAGRNERNEIHVCIASLERDCHPHLEKIEIFPKPVETTAPAGTPEEIASQFISAQEMFRNENITPHNVLMACRMALEAAVNDMGKTGGEENLAAKIKKLHAEGRISNSLLEWARMIKDFGNEGAHHMQGDRVDAEEMLEFTRVFLQYVYELPNRINAMQDRLANMRQNH